MSKAYAVNANFQGACGLLCPPHYVTLCSAYRVTLSQTPYCAVHRAAVEVSSYG